MGFWIGIGKSEEEGLGRGADRGGGIEVRGLDEDSLAGGLVPSLAAEIEVGGEEGTLLHARGKKVGDSDRLYQEPASMLHVRRIPLQQGLETRMSA